MATVKYRPTGQVVDVVGIANEGQTSPEDPGRGMRLYAIRFRDGRLGQASAEELSKDGAAYWHGDKECPRCQGRGVI